MKKPPHPDKPIYFLLPRYWFTWLGLGVLYLVAQLPYPWQINIGRAMGKLAYRIMRDRRHIADVNLRLCFPEKTSEQRRALIKKNFESVGIGLIEMGMAWWTPQNKIATIGHVNGLENLNAALAQGKGAIMLCAHFTTLEITARIIGRHMAIRTIYREQKNRLFNAVMERHRRQIVAGIIHRKDTRGMIKSLKQNVPIYYAGDQDYGKKHSIFVPFFGVQAATITGMLRLAAMTGAPIIPSTHYRIDKKPYYVITLHPALENFPTGDDEKDLLRINQIVENMIVEKPEQYYWIHRRFKTRPEGEARPY